MDAHDSTAAPERRARRTLLSLLPRGGVGAEVGVHLGDFSALLLQETAPARLHLVDPWEFRTDAEHSASWYGERGANGQQEMDRRHAHVQQRFTHQIAAGTVEVHRGSSGQVLPGFADDSLDWIYIDGDHAYDAVKQDLDLAWLKVRPGGLIAGDDYAIGKWWGDGVVRAVNEFIGTHRVVVQFFRAGQFLLRKRR
ncbi:MAG: hypothetical protein CALGDGBN_03325 [Pseudomonadales bacterium]|nr:hypothetical protein [Pseudomonadales bacterium]